jgi:hypothetical protein
LSAGVCTSERRMKCEAEFGAAHLVWTCANCPRARLEDLSPYTMKILRLADLQFAGYPLAANDLTLEEWFDLGRVKEWLLENIR